MDHSGGWEQAGHQPDASFDDGIHIGIVRNIVAEGLVISSDLGHGFCYKRDVLTDIDWRTLALETQVELRVRRLPGKSPSLAIVGILPPETTVPTTATISASSLSRPDRTKKWRDISRKAGNGVLTGDNQNYTNKIKTVLDAEVADINAVGKQMAQKTTPLRAGHVAEADHVATFNTDASFNRSTYRAERLNSHELNSVDIQVTDGSKVTGEYSAKVYKDAESTAIAQRKYEDQQRLVPTDQLDEVRSKARTQADKDSASQDPRIQDRGAEFKKVHDNATDRLEGGGNESTPRTRQESQEMADKAKDGQVNTADIVGSVGQRMWQGATQGAKVGAIGAAAVSTLMHGIDAVSSVHKRRKAVPHAVGDFAQGVALDTAEGAVKGAAAGAATAGARVLAENMAEGLGKRFLGSAGPAAIATTGIDIAMTTVKLARGKMTGTEYARSVTASVGSGTGGFVGSVVGGIITAPIGLPWLGVLLGGFVGSFIGSAVGSGLADGVIEGMADDPAVIAAATTEVLSGKAGEAAPYNGPTFDRDIAYRIAQIERLANALGDRSSLVYPGRVLRMPAPGHYQHAADLLMAHKGRIYAIDFKNWKGILRVISDRKTKDGEYTHLTKTKFNAKGHNDIMLRNPIVDLKRFAMAAQRKLTEYDPRWHGHAVQPFVVYPDLGLEEVGEIAADRRFMSFSNFVAFLQNLGEGETLGWMQDGLSSIPTWDIVQDSYGSFHQGLIQSERFTLHIDQGQISIPFSHVMRMVIDQNVDVTRAGVTWAQDKVFIGTINDDQPFVLSRKGHSTAFSLKDLRLICPANMLFAA